MLKKILLILIIFQLIVVKQLISQEKKINTTKHSVYFEPTLLFINSFAAFYGHKLNDKNEIIAGFWYNKSTETYPKLLEYPGYEQAYTLILAYRRFFWRNVHAEYQLYPAYSVFYEDQTDKKTGTFVLFNEFRVGYKFEFNIKKIPFLINLQWPVGFTLYHGNTPQSFIDIKKEDQIFYIYYPNIYLGIRF